MNRPHDRLSVRLPKRGRRRQTLTASPGDTPATHGDSQTHDRKKHTVNDHQWLDHIIQTGELPEHFGQNTDHTTASASVRMTSRASAATAGPEGRADSTRAPHAHGITGNGGGEVLG